MNSNHKLVTMCTLDSNRTSCICVHSLHNPYKPILNTLGTLSKAFSKTTNAKSNFFFLPKYFSCNCLTKNIASVVPCPGMTPNCVSSMFTFLCNPFNHFHYMFSQLQAPRSKASPFPSRNHTLIHDGLCQFSNKINNTSLQHFYYNTWHPSCFTALLLTDFLHPFSLPPNCRTSIGSADEKPSLSHSNSFSSRL